MITILVDQVSENQRFEINGVPTMPPGQPQKLMSMIDDLLTSGGTIVLTGTLAEAAVLRALRRVREGSYKPEEVKISVRAIYDSGQEATGEMPVSADGDILCRWPGGFFNHRADEIF